MDHLPAGFAEALGRVVEPGHEAAVASIIAAATRLDDEGLRRFLDAFAARVRSSHDRITSEELQQLLLASKERGPSDAP
jgi:hypothetical protein